MCDFDLRFLTEASEILELCVEEVHRHTLVLKVVGALPAVSYFRGRLVVILHPARTLVPFGLRCRSIRDYEALPRSIGMTAKLHGRRLFFTGDIHVDLEGKGIDLKVHPVEEVGALSRRCARRLDWLQPKDGGQARAATSLYRALDARLSRFGERMKMGDFGGVGDLIRPLIGLGFGSTPSGDDMIAGALAALWSLDSSQAMAARNALARDIAQLTPVLTTRTSLEMLWHAARGYFPEALVNAVRALGNECISKNEFARFADLLFYLGATSGRDMAAGMRAIFEIYGREHE